MEIHNYMEDAIKDILEEIMGEREDVCKCDKCKMDITAWALNRLPPKYIVTQKGRVYTKLQEINIQFRTDVVKELTHAIEHIKDKPQH
jgi:competence protein ComFB